MLWQREQNLICQGCGHPLDETTDEEDRAAWIAEPVTCWSCASRDRATKGAETPPGVRYRTRNRAKTNEGVNRGR